MSVRITPPPNVSIRNSRGVSYILGDERTDGSIRLILKENDKDITLEQRKSGVQNPTGIRIAAGTLFLDHEASISSVGTSIQVNTTESDTKSLVVDIEFDDSGTVLLPRSPIVDDLVDNLVIQPDFSEDIISTQVSGSLTFATSRLLHTLNLKTGSVAATEDISFILSRGITPGGTVVFDLNIPASAFPANSDISIDMGVGLGFNAGAEVFFSFTSISNISLLGDISDLPFITIDTQLSGFQSVLTENFVIDNELNMAFGNDLNPIYPNQFNG